MTWRSESSTRSALLSRWTATVVGAFLILSFPAMAEVRILEVTGVPMPERQGFMPVYLKKFQTFSEASGSREVRITWETDQPLPAGTLIIFEYRTRGERDKVIYVTLERPIRGSHQTKLPLCESEAITAWRVRIATGAVTWAMRATPDWR